MKTTCNFIYTSPTPSVITRKGGAGVVGPCIIHLVVGSTQFSPTFLQMIAATLPVAVRGGGIMVLLSVATTAAFTFAVTMEVDTTGKIVLVVGAKLA